MKSNVKITPITSPPAPVRCIMYRRSRMYRMSPATAANRDLRLMPNAIAAKIAASSSAEAPIPNSFTPANDNATTSDVMPATNNAAHIPPDIAFSAPLTSDTSSQYHLLLMADASSFENKQPEPGDDASLGRHLLGQPRPDLGH